MQHCDVAIVGGGLVGASLAHALAAANTDLKIILFDKQPASQLYQAELDNRGLALSYISAQLLAQWHIWPKLIAHAYPITTVHVSTKGRFGFTRFTAERLGLPVLGYVVPASALGSALLAGLPPNVTVKRPVLLQDLKYIDERWTLITTAEKLSTESVAQEKFSAALVVGADGSDSLVRKCAGIENNVFAYYETAIVTNINTEINSSTAFERFTDFGILAMLPFGAKRMKCVLTVPTLSSPKMRSVYRGSSSRDLIAANDHEFLEIVQDLFGDRLGKLHSVSPRMTFPLQQIQAQNITAPGLILLGNAANTLHPVGAQGFNLALRDVMTLTDLLNNPKINNSDSDIVTKYATRRAQDQKNTRNFTHLLATLPANLKHNCLLASQFLPPLNNMLAKRGLGTWT